MKVLFIFIVIILLTVIAFYGYMGGFKRLVPRIEIAGGETLAYEKVKGDYRQSGEVSNRVYYTLLDEMKIETYKGFGIYYDVPGKVKKENLRSEIGCIIEDNDLDKVELIKERFEVRVIPNKKVIIAEYPYRGKISSIIGVIKVYPLLKKIAVDNNYSGDSAVMEIWDIPNKKIIYRKNME